MASGKAATTAVFTAAILHWTHLFPDTAHHISQFSNTSDIPHQPQSDTPPTHPSVAYQRQFFCHHSLPRADFQPWLCYAFMWGATPLFRLHTPPYRRWVNSVTRGLCICLCATLFVIYAGGRGARMHLNLSLICILFTYVNMTIFTDIFPAFYCGLWDLWKNCFVKKCKFGSSM